MTSFQRVTKEVKDVRFVGSAVSLYELVDVKVELPSSVKYSGSGIGALATCDVISVLDTLYHQLVVAMGMAHED